MRMNALIGGWNARDPLPDMPSGDAVILTNLIPGLTGVVQRPGYLLKTTGLGAAVNALMNWNGPSSGKLFGVAGGNLFDVSSAGAVGAPVIPQAAQATFTESGTKNFLATDTITIGNQTFTFVSSIGSTAGNILVSADTNAGFVTTWTNIIASLAAAAIGGPATANYVPNAAVPNVSVAVGNGASTGATYIVTATSPGSAGNALASTYTDTGGTSAGSFDAVTLGTTTAGLSALSASSNYNSVMFASAAPANYLFFVNGVDPAHAFNGSVWSTPTWTGGNGNPFSSVAVIANRLWFAEKNSLHVWYAGVQAVSGGLTLFDLGTQCFLGGSIVAMNTWSQQGGTTPQDYACFFTSAGEVIIYQGTDPSSSTTWGLVGRFRIPPPVGYNNTLKSGADVAVLTTLGGVPLSAVLPISISDQEIAAVTDKIRGAFQSATAAQGALPGWQIVEFPQLAVIFVNVPQSDGVSFQQYVMATVNGSWCNFVDIPALSWSLFGNLLYFGDTVGNVYQFGVGQSDNGAGIQYAALPAFTAFATPGFFPIPNGFKQFLMARPFVVAQPGTVPPVQMRVDFDNSIPSLAETAAPESGSPWDTSPWDTSSWGAAPTAVALWQSVTGLGQFGSVLVAGASFPSSRRCGAWDRGRDSARCSQYRWPIRPHDRSGQCVGCRSG